MERDKESFEELILSEIKALRDEIKGAKIEVLNDSAPIEDNEDDKPKLNENYGGLLNV